MDKKVSVVIPVHNTEQNHAARLFTDCLESLKLQKRIGEIVVIDDGSDRDQSEIIDKIDGIKVYHNAGAEGFISSVNRGVKKSSEDYILVLNSDTVAMPKAVERMAEALDEGYAISGARLVFPLTHPNKGLQGKIQHYSVGFYNTGEPYHPFMYVPGDSPSVLVRRDVNAVTGAALAITREWWDKVGGLDRRYGKGVFEDVDLCLMVRKAGGSILANPDALLYHWQHASQDRINNWFNEKSIMENLGILYAKHGLPKCDDWMYYKGVVK